MMENQWYQEITYKIIGAAMSIHQRHGPAYKESFYQTALQAEFEQLKLSFEVQKPIQVFDSGRQIGLYYLDFVVEDKVIVEIKALESLNSSHLGQVITYLAATGYQVGLLINFGRRSLEYKRVLPPKKLSEHRVNRQWLFVPDWLKER